MIGTTMLILLLQGAEAGGGTSTATALSRVATASTASRLANARP